MSIAISQDDVLAVLQRDFPREYEISCLRVVVEAQARRIAELEQAQPATTGTEE